MSPEAAAPPSDPLDLVLHIGSGKTGTSSIQSFLHRNRARLADVGYLYPRTPGRPRHTRLSLFIQPDDVLVRRRDWREQRFSSTDRFRKVFRRRLFREIDESGLSRVLMSDEALYGSSSEALARLRRFTDRLAGSLRLVVYLRRQDDHLVSRYQQAVKTGETRRLAERTQQLDMTAKYDHYARLRMWQRLLEPTELVVRRFERDRFVDGSLYQDFLDAAGIDLRADALDHNRGPRNESLDAETVEFLRILNIFRAEHPGMAAALPRDNIPLFARLVQVSTGPVLTLPAAMLDAFMSQWAESNRRVALDVLGDDSGELFQTPRRSGNTTTEQRLDPARLGHFATVLELPEQMHAPLRALVEREAKSAG